MAKPDPDHNLKTWLAGRTAAARPWPTLGFAAGLTGVFAGIAQAFALAAFFQGWIFDHKSFAELQLWWLLFPVAAGVRAVAGWAKEEAGFRASRTVREQLRADLVDRVGYLGPAWKTGQPAGALASKLVEQVDGLDAYTARYLAQQKLAVWGPVTILAAVFAVNWICGLILLATAPLIPLFMVLIGLGAQAVQTKQLRSLSRMSGHFLDILRGLTTLKLVGAHRRQADRVAEVSEDFRVKTMEVLRLAFLSSTMLEFFSVLAIALTALYLGFTLLGEINFGLALTFQTSMFVLLLAPDFYQPLRDLGTLYHARGEAMAAAGQLKPLFDTPSPSVRGGTAVPASGAPALEVSGLTFSHVPGVPVLTGFGFRAAAGEAVAVTGPSGVGKTTLLRLLQGQLTPQEGVVTADGIPLADLDPDLWRSKIGWMDQHPRLLSASWADNLRMARRDTGEVQWREALEFAGLGDWFRSLPGGFDTRLGEGGRTVSGGQLRRLALARLKLRDADLLLLDEPTASLDEATQDSVLAGIATLKKGKTLVLLTHHPKPLVLADRVVAL